MRSLEPVKLLPSLPGNTHELRPVTIDANTAALADSEGYLSPHGMYFFGNFPEMYDWWISIVVPPGWALAVDPNQPPEWNTNPRYVNCTIARANFYLVPSDTIPPPPPPPPQSPEALALITAVTPPDCA